MICTGGCNHGARFHKVRDTILSYGYITFLSGWSSKFQDGSLTLYEVLCSDDSGPVICKTVQVKSDFTWAATYRGHTVPNNCGLLQKFPLLINTG